MQIGDFSKLSFVTVKALRHYDEIGLFKPQHVDEFTGYRYYSASQLPHLNHIKSFKNMGLSLEEAARLLKDDVSVSSVLDLLQAKQAEIKVCLGQEAERLTRVKEWLKETEKEGKMPEYEVGIKKTAPQWVAAVRGVVPTYGDIGQLFEKLYGPVYASQAVVTGPPIAIYHDCEYKERDVDIEVASPLASKADIEGIDVKQLPACEVASVMHQGPYDTIHKAYNALMAWIEGNGYKMAGPNREIYFTDPNTDIAPDDYVTEVQMPITRS